MLCRKPFYLFFSVFFFVASIANYGIVSADRRYYDITNYLGYQSVKICFACFGLFSVVLEKQTTGYTFNIHCERFDFLNHYHALASVMRHSTTALVLRFGQIHVIFKPSASHKVIGLRYYCTLCGVPELLCNYQLERLWRCRDIPYNYSRLVIGGLFKLAVVLVES